MLADNGTGRISIALLVCLVAMGSGCSSKSTDPINQTMISEVGELEQEGELPRYRYDGVLFYGDIALDEYEAAREIVLSLAIDGETLMYVRNYRVYPEDGWIQFPGDSFSLQTCVESTSAMCVRGMNYRFVIERNRVVLAESGEWTTLP